MESLTPTPIFRTSTQIMSEPDEDNYGKATIKPITLTSNLSDIKDIHLEIKALLNRINDCLDSFQGEEVAQPSPKGIDVTQEFDVSTIYAKCDIIKRMGETNIEKANNILKRLNSYL